MNVFHYREKKGRALRAVVRGLNERRFVGKYFWTSQNIKRNVYNEVLVRLRRLLVEMIVFMH